MKKFLLSILTATLFSLGCNAQLFWEISGNGLEKPSYLFGTHHVAPITILDSIAGFKEALTAVDKVYGELDMKLAQSPESQQTMLGYTMATPDSLLTSILSASQVDSLDKVIKHYMGPMASASQFANFKPALVSTVLGLAQTQAAFPTFNPQQQLDGEIQARAIAAGKEIYGFETVDEQCKAMFGTSIIDQANSLMEIVRNINKAETIALRLANAYVSGDLNTMLTIMEDPAYGNDSEWTERMIYKRNTNWVRILAGLLPTASVLIAVGAGHLPGEKGLINQLRNEGYTVKPVE